jgi:hypothetical protein
MNGIGEREIGRMKRPPFLEAYSTLAGFHQFFWVNFAGVEEPEGVRL